jgi:hypothetical protein
MSVVWTGLSYSTLLPRRAKHENVLRFAKETDSERVISFGSVLPSSVYALDCPGRISDEELKGIKFHPALQRIYADMSSISRYMTWRGRLT